MGAESRASVDEWVITMDDKCLVSDMVVDGVGSDSPDYVGKHLSFVKRGTHPNKGPIDCVHS